MANDPSTDLLTKLIGHISESFRQLVPMVWPPELVDLIHDAVGEEYGDDE